jgi:CarboxypepD_reg-like domain
MRVRFSPWVVRYVNRRTAALALLAPMCAAAQEPRPTTGTLRGTVVAGETGNPLPFTIVALGPGPTERFTDERGVFTISGLERGRYRLLVRQIGYTPADTSVIIHDADVHVRIELRHLAIELPPVTVTARAACTQPGQPDRDLTPALADVFDQLLENARRFELLADSYPFRFRHERMYRTVTGRGDTVTIELDSIEQTSQGELERYQPGRVVAWGSGPFFGRRVVLLPGLAQFADSAFIATHCFLLAGRDTIAGETLVRVDFDPAASLRSADLSGAAYLDSLTYQIRFTRIALTRPARALAGVVAFVATTRFSEIAPGIMLHHNVHAVTTLQPSARSSLPTQRIEEQRLLSVHFVRPLFGKP